MKIFLGFLLSLLVTPLFAMNTQVYSPPAICNYTYDYLDPYSQKDTVRIVWVQTTPRGLSGYDITPEVPSYWNNGFCNSSIGSCTWKMVPKNGATNGNSSRYGIHTCPSPQQLYCDSTGNVAARNLQEGWVANPQFPCNAGTSTFNFFSVKAQHS